MNPILFAMRRPITLMMGIVALLGAGVLALCQMRVDIFPALNEPQIYVINNYAGMDPSQIEGFITNVYEQNFQYVDGLKRIESKNVQNLVLIKLSFYPGTDMSAAMSQVVSLSNRARGQMPPSVLPPFVMRFDAANVPIGYLVLDSQDRPLGELTDLAMTRIRPLLGERIPGTVSFSPFGSNTRAIVITVDPDRLRSYNLSPEDVVSALNTGNIVSPSGNLYTEEEMPMVPTNALVRDAQELGEIPITPGKNVYIHDVATIRDTTDINYGCALVNGRKSVYLPIVKKDTASTLTVVREVRDALPLFREVVPKDVQVRYEFDESPTVRAAIKSVATEGAIGAALVGLMILVFLRDVRTVVVVLFNIPLALTAALVGLWLTGNTLNIMSLGGLALAIGILVDEAVVTVENTHSQMHHTDSLARAARRAFTATAAARFLAMACVLAVFIPTFIMKEPVRSLFMPLTLAVGFSMIASYALSSTLVPVLTVWLMKHRRPDSQRATFFDRILPAFGRLVTEVTHRRWVVVPAYLAGCGLALWLAGRQLGTELFPQVDSGQFVLRFRAPPGSQYELTRRTAVRILDVIDKETGGQVAISMGYVGLAATNTSTNNLLLFMRGPDDGELRVRLNEESRVPLAGLRERLREAVPKAIIPWLRETMEKDGLSREQAARRADLFQLGFEPGDIVSEVMSLGSPMPVEVVVAGPDREKVRTHALKIFGELKKLPALRDVPALPAARLPGGTRGYRPPAGRTERRDRQGRGRQPAGGDVVEPVRGQELLARPQQWRRLPGAGPSSDSPHESSRTDPNAASAKGELGHESDAPRRGEGRVGHGPGPGGSQLDAALLERHRQRRRRGPRPGLAPHRAGNRRCRPPAARRPRPRPRPSRPHGRDVWHPLRRAAPLGGRHPDHAHRLFPVVPDGAGFDRGGAGRRLWGRGDPAAYPHHAEYRVVHGSDHVYRRVRGQLGHADDIHG